MGTNVAPEVACPKCGGRTWDNRLTKRNPKAPDFKCRDRSCDGAIWPERDPQDTPATAAARASLGAPPEYGARLNSPGETVGPGLMPAQGVPVRDTRPQRAAERPLTPEAMNERATRIESAMVRATQFVVKRVLPELDKAPGDGPIVVTVDAARLVAALMDSYGKGGLL